MDYVDFMTHIKVCEVLKKEPASRYKKVNDLLCSIWEDTEIITIPDHALTVKDGEIISSSRDDINSKVLGAWKVVKEK